MRDRNSGLTRPQPSTAPNRRTRTLTTLSSLRPAFVLSPLSAALLVFALFAAPPVRAQQPKEQQPSLVDIVRQTVQNEKQARQHRSYFRYTSYERSGRTGGHLWQEEVVETKEGLIRRLVAEDGKPLSPQRAAAEDKRIAALIADPSSVHSLNADLKADEARLGQLLEILPKAFLFTPDGVESGCMRIAFRPDPAFNPSGFDERVVHGMGGAIEIRVPEDRLCGIQGHLIDRVNLGYGLLGHVEKGSSFSVTRVPVTAIDWKNAKISLHLDGKVLMLKTISRNEEASHNQHRVVSPQLSLAEAAALTRPDAVPSSPGQSGGEAGASSNRAGAAAHE